MFTNKKFTRHFSVVAMAIAGLLISWTTHAATTANLNVSATVTTSCSIAANPLAFSNYDPSASSATTGIGSVVLTCVKNAQNVWVGLDAGAGTGGSTTTRVMQFGSNKLNYTLNQPSGSGTGNTCATPGANWGNTSTTGLPYAPSTNGAVTYQVCGAIAAGQYVPAGSYADTVVATINFQ